MKNKINFNIIEMWMQNQKFKNQFPGNKIYINDEIKDILFISIDK